MTRFKELRQIELAIKNRDKAALEWALGYCKMRLEIAQRKDHRQCWSKIERRVREAMASPK